MLCSMLIEALLRLLPDETEVAHLKRREMNMGRTIAATCMALAISAGLSGAAVARPSGPADEPWERGFEQDTSNSARVVVELGSLDAQTAAHLALLLPNWDEQINAGAEQLTLPRSLAESLVASGEPLRIVSNAPDIPLIWPSCIPKLDEVYSWLDAFAATHPDLVEVIDIGDSWCKIEGDCETPRRDSIPGDDLYVVRVTNERSTASKSGRLFIDAGMHARELSTIPLIQAMIESLVQEYGTDPQVTWLLDHREIYLGDRDQSRRSTIGRARHGAAVQWRPMVLSQERASHATGVLMAAYGCESIWRRPQSQPRRQMEFAWP